MCSTKMYYCAYHDFRLWKVALLCHKLLCIYIALPPNDPCFLAKPIPKAALRGTQCPVYEVQTPICDRLITPGWYSVKVENKNVDMPTSCITGGTCGTSSPIWLNGNIPFDNVVILHFVKENLRFNSFVDISKWFYYL